MATVPRHGRKGGKVVSSPSLAPRVITPGSAMSPVSLQTPGEGTTIISDPNAAHPFDPDAITNVLKRTTTSEANVLQFDLDAIQHIGKGVMVGRTKQVRTTLRQPQVTKTEVVSKLKSALASQQKKSQRVSMHSLGLQKLGDHDVLIVRRPHEALFLAATISTTVQGARVLVVVPKYFEVCPVRKYLNSLDVGGGNVTAGAFYGETFDGSSETSLWVTSAETALLYLTRLYDIAPFTHVVVPGLSDTTHLLLCFVRAFCQWLLKAVTSSQSVRLVVTPERSNCSETGGMFEGLKMTLVDGDDEKKRAPEFSYGETCALAGKEMMEMEKDSSGKYPGPTKRLIEHTARIAAEVVRCAISRSELPQVIVIFTAEARDVLTAMQDVRIEGCSVYSGLKSTEDTSCTRHRVHVMNHVRHALDTDNEYTMVIDMGTIRRPTAQHKSESFMAASTTEWETKRERAERISILDGKEGHCYFALYPDDVAATAFQDDAKSLPDVFGVEDVFIQSARLHLSLENVMKALIPAIPSEMLEHTMSKLAEKCVIANTQGFAITFLGEMAARLPVELDIACFIIGGCNIGLGEAALAIGSVAALAFRSTTPLTYSGTRWSECTGQSRSNYGGGVAGHSDLLADTLVFIEWLQLRARGESTTAFLETYLLQEFKLEKIEELMSYMRKQLTNYVFLEQFDLISTLEAMTSSIKECSTIFLLMMSVSLARRAGFIRDAGHLNEKDRYASMVFVRTSKRVVPHSFIPSSVKWDTGKIIVPILLKNNTTIFAGLFSLIHTPYFFVSLLLLYPQVEYSKPVVTDKGRVVYFGVSCNRQMKRFMVMIEEAAQILDFREKINLALGCMHALRTLPQPVSRTKFALLLKEHDRLFDMDRLHKDIQRQLLELVTNLSVQEHQGSFETFATHCTVPKEILPLSETPATDVAMLRRFADGTLWEKRQCTPASSIIPNSATQGVKGDTVDENTVQMGLWNENNDDDDDVEIIQESYFLRHGPLIEDDDDD